VITEWFLGIASSVWTWFGGLFPEWTPPEFLTTADDQINAILADLDGVAVWADWQYITVVVGVVIGTWALSFLVKIALRVAAYIPFFGGAG